MLLYFSEMSGYSSRMVLKFPVTRISSAMSNTPFKSDNTLFRPWFSLGDLIINYRFFRHTLPITSVR